MERDIIQNAALSSPRRTLGRDGRKGNLRRGGEGGNPLAVLERELRHVHRARSTIAQSCAVNAIRLFKPGKQFRALSSRNNIARPILFCHLERSRNATFRARSR